MTRICKICQLHPFLLRWVEQLIKKSFSLRTISSTLKDHGIIVSYQSVNRHKKHMDLESKIQRLAWKIERWKKRKPTPIETLEELQRQRDEFKRWLSAEQNPSREALDAYSRLEEKIMRWKKIIEMKKMSKLLR
jgi:hypothetical protein